MARWYMYIMETVNLTFNSHEKFKALLAKGFTEEQAEGIIDVFSEVTLPNAATREDIRKVEVSVAGSIRKLEVSIVETEGRLTKLIYINAFTTIAILGTLFKLLS